MKVRNAFTKVPRKEPKEYEETLTVQYLAEDCDLRKMMEKHRITGQIDVKVGDPYYADFSEVKDYQSALNQVMAAEEVFNSLPAKIRDRFGHNAGKLLEFLQNPDNKQEAIELGLLEDPERPPLRKAGEPIDVEEQAVPEPEKQPDEAPKN